ncbi:histidine phosphatase superfamily [Leptodontidium sp. MPI-SDFR-AT-0119]|nr:histidine phosphatase superfamily [Leptodontidium sp. MPI-SDFR-AT-0119]
MAPTVILIRHAQARHNATNNIPDPALTELGFGEQCDELAKHLEHELPLAQEIELIVVSPMRRTLQTAQQGLGWLMKRGVPVILRAEFQENSDSPCDTGSPIPEMEKEWPQFDWSTVDPRYPATDGLYECTREGLTKRGIAARTFLRNRPEKVIAVVSHAGFLRTSLCSRRFENADYRIFNFGEEEEADVPALVEWALTEKKGGGLGKSEKGIFELHDGDYAAKEKPEPEEVVNENPS